MRAVARLTRPRELDPAGGPDAGRPIARLRGPWAHRERPTPSWCTVRAMRSLSLLLLCAAACGGSPSPAPRAVDVAADPGAREPAPAPTTPAWVPILEPEIEAVVLSRPMFAGWTVVPLAQLSRGTRVAVAVWPAIDPAGRVPDDDLIGVTLERDGDGWAVVTENWRATESAAWARELGGEAEVVRRGEGVPLEGLAERLVTLPRRFAEQVAAGDRDGAVRTAVDFSRLFAFRVAVDTDTVSELLAKHVADRVRIEAEAAVREGDRARVRARFFEGERVAEVEDLIATPVEGDETRWVLSDHERVHAGER